SALALRKNLTAHFHEGTFGEFETWAQKYADAQTPLARAELEAAGIALATKRRTELKTLITKDPKHALELAVSKELRDVMPKSISMELEQQIDEKAALAEAFPCDCCGRSMPADGNHVYQVSYGSTVLHANVYGNTKPGFSVQPVPVKGISVDQEIAVDESSGTAKSREGCTGGSLGIANPNELPDDGFAGHFGKKKYLLIRINFADDSTEPINEFTAYDVLRQVD